MVKRASVTTASSEGSNVKAANAAYYKALSARDIGAMEMVWTCGADNILIAPPVNPVTHIGWEAIKRNWENYWPTFNKFSVSMTVTAVNINGPVAWVHGIENVTPANEGGRGEQQPQLRHQYLRQAGRPLADGISPVCGDPRKLLRAAKYFLRAHFVAPPSSLTGNLRFAST